jgi:cation diffusion facilitator family transporter
MAAPMPRHRWGGAGSVGGVHVISGVRDPSVSFPLAAAVDDRDERHRANRAVAVSAAGLAVTGLVELVIALVSGSVALLGDALHNLSDVSTSLLVFVGFRASRRAATPRYPYGFERAEDLAGIGVAAVIWASAAVAGTESVAKLVHHGTTQHLGWGIAAAAAGILGNQLVARYKLAVGRRIQSATMIADAKHSWLDALSSAGAMLGLVGVAVGWSWADAVAGLFVTGFICHVGWQVSSDIAHRLLDGVDPAVVTTAEATAAQTDGVMHAHARARWTGRTLRVEVEGWVEATTTIADADRIGCLVANRLGTELCAASHAPPAAFENPSRTDSVTVCGQGRRAPAIAVSTRFSGMPLTRGDHQHAVQPPTSESVPIGHAEIEKGRRSALRGQRGIVGHQRPHRGPRDTGR